jgi:hypothetical protein
MPGPVDPDRPSGLSPGRDLCIGFQCVQTVAVCIHPLHEAVPDFRVCGHPSGLQSSLCTLHMFCSVLGTSSTHATLGTSGWLILTRWGLAPHKKRQASLGARTPGLSCGWKRERRRSGRWKPSAPGPCSVQLQPPRLRRLMPLGLPPMAQSTIRGAPHRPVGA